MLKQSQQRPLARIEGDEVEVIEQPWLGQLAQLGVDEAAAEGQHDGRVMGLDGLRNAKGRVHRAGEGHRDQHDRRRMAGDGGQGQRMQGVVDRFFGATSAAARGSKVGWLVASFSA